MGCFRYGRSEVEISSVQEFVDWVWVWVSALEVGFIFEYLYLYRTYLDEVEF